jgi:hypothetical protein
MPWKVQLMAVTSHVYPKAIDAINKKTINLTTDTFKVGLCTGSAATWGATQEAYQFISDITGAYTEVVTGGGYTSGYAGRLALTTLTLTISGNKEVWTCTAPAPISFGTTTTISAASMFIADYTIGTTDATTPVIAIIDFGQTVTSTAAAFTYTVDAVNGLAAWTAS